MTSHLEEAKGRAFACGNECTLLVNPATTIPHSGIKDIYGGQLSITYGIYIQNILGMERKWIGQYALEIAIIRDDKYPRI